MCFGARTIDDMDFPTLIVALGKVLTKVCPAAFLASERGTSDEARDRHEIEEPPRIRIAWRRLDALRLRTIVGIELPDGVGAGREITSGAWTGSPPSLLRAPRDLGGRFAVARKPGPGPVPGR